MRGFPPRRLLVPFDLTPASWTALDAAKTLARRWDASLELVHVRDVVAAAAWVGPEGLPLIAGEEESERRTAEALARAAAGLARVRTRRFAGALPGDLARLARRGEADLVVMGTRGHAGLARALFGSVAEGVTRRAEIPVLAVHESKAPLKVARILAPWNGRSYAVRAVRYAARLAADFKAELGVLHAAPKGSAVDEAGLRRKLAPLLDPLLGARWRLAVRRGDPREQIMLEAGSGRFGLVVLSSHVRPLSADVVVGSTLERLLRRCEIPVLACPCARPARAVGD